MQTSLKEKEIIPQGFISTWSLNLKIRTQFRNDKFLNPVDKNLILNYY